MLAHCPLRHEYLSPKITNVVTIYLAGKVRAQNAHSGERTLTTLNTRGLLWPLTSDQYMNIITPRTRRGRKTYKTIFSERICLCESEVSIFHHETTKEKFTISRSDQWHTEHANHKSSIRKSIKRIKAHCDNDLTLHQQAMSHRVWDDNMIWRLTVIVLFIVFRKPSKRTENGVVTRGERQYQRYS